jgi:hypothetical protein
MRVARATPKADDMLADRRLRVNRRLACIHDARGDFRREGDRMQPLCGYSAVSSAFEAVAPETELVADLAAINVSSTFAVSKCGSGFCLKKSSL